MGGERSARGRVLVAVVSAALCTVGAAADPDARPRRILSIHAFEPGVPADAIFAGGLRAALPLGTDLSLYSEHLDRLRFAEPGYEEAFRAWLRKKYASAPPDIVVAVGADAIDFVADPRRTPFPGAPVVFGMVDDRAMAGRPLAPRTTGVTEHIAIRETFDLALALFPRTRQVVLVGGAAAADRPFNELLRSEIAASGTRLEVVELFGLPMRDLQARLRELPSDAIVLVVTLFQDGAGRQWSGPRSVPALTAASPAPIFSTHAHLLGLGIVGGVLTDHAEAGRLVGRTVLRILAGEPAEAIPVQRGGSNRIGLDGRQLDRWGVPDALVPVGAEIRPREPTPWVRYRWPLTLFALGFLLQSALIAWLLVERRRRWRAEASARENLAVVAHMNRVAAIGELAGSFAHELNSPLGAVLNNAQAARRLVASGAGDAAEVRSCLDDIVGDVKRAGEVIRRIRGVMRREDWTPVRLDVAAVIRDAVRLVQAEARDRDVTLEVEVGAELPDVTGDDVQLVQVVLNLVLNAVEAVAAMPEPRRRVRISAEPLGGAMAIRVADAGPGVPPALAERIFEPFFTTKPVGLGMGLSITRSIVEAHGGSISVSQVPGGGAQFEVLLAAARGAYAAPVAKAG